MTTLNPLFIVNLSSKDQKGVDTEYLMSMLLCNGRIIANLFQEFQIDSRSGKPRIPRGMPSFFYEITRYMSFTVVPTINEIIFTDQMKLYDDFRIVFKSELDLALFIEFLKGKIGIKYLDTQVNDCKKIPHEYQYGLYQKGTNIENGHTTFLPEAKSDAEMELSSCNNNEIPYGELFTDFYDEKDQSTFKYSDIKKSWKLLGSKGDGGIGIYQNEFFQRVEVVNEDINNIKFNTELFTNKKFSINEAKEIIQDVMISYIIYNWDGTKYYYNQAQLMFPFFCSYLKCIKEDKSFEKEIFESKLFNAYAHFYEFGSFSEIKENQIRKNAIPIIINLSKLLSEKFPELTKLFRSKFVISMDFLIPIFSNFFYDIFQTKDIIILWSFMKENITNIDNFIICFLISYLIEVKNSDEFKNMEPIKEDDFLKSFTKIIEELRIKIKMDVLLSHTVEIQNNLFKINN